MKSIRVEVDEETHKQLKQDALDGDTTIAELIRTAIKGQPLRGPKKIKTEAPPQKVVVPPEISQEFKRETPKEKLEREEREVRLKRMGINE